MKIVLLRTELLNNYYTDLRKNFHMHTKKMYITVKPIQFSLHFESNSKKNMQNYFILVNIITK